MSLRRPTIVIFDMDGTTVRHLSPLLLHMLEFLDDLSFRVAQRLSRLTGKTLTPPRIVERGEDGTRPRLAVRQALHRMVLRGHAERIVEPCPGIYAILAALQSRKVQLALVSNGLGSGYGHDILKAFDLGKYFEVALFREDIGRPKPQPDPLLAALKRLPAPPVQTDVIWHIGDRRKDILAAMAAQPYLPCPIEPLGYGLKAAATILEKNLGHDHIVRSYPELQKRLGTLF